MTHTHRVLLKSALLLALLGAMAALAQTQDFATEIAKADLAQDGITHPTHEQLGMATRDVQALRDSGMGWGAIANSLGLRLGEVVSAANRARHAGDARMDPADKSHKSQKSAKHADRTTVAAAVAVSADAPGLSVGGGRGVGSSGQGKGNGKGGGNSGGNGGGGGKR